MAKTSAFVTGGTGFLGLNLVEQLVAQGWQVTALYRRSSDLALISRLPDDLVECDILESDSLRRAIPEGVFAVFHLAADTSVWSRHDQRQSQINIEGTRNVISAARARANASGNAVVEEVGDVEFAQVPLREVLIVRSQPLSETAVRESSRRPSSSLKAPSMIRQVAS